MSAIPIEVDLVAGDGGEIQFSMDEMSEESLLQVELKLVYTIHLHWIPQWKQMKVEIFLLLQMIQK